MATGSSRHRNITCRASANDRCNASNALWHKCTMNFIPWRQMPNIRPKYSSRLVWHGSKNFTTFALAIMSMVKMCVNSMIVIRTSHLFWYTFLEIFTLGVQSTNASLLCPLQKNETDRCCLIVDASSEEGYIRTIERSLEEENECWHRL